MRNWAGKAISGAMFAMALTMGISGSGALAATVQVQADPLFPLRDAEQAVRQTPQDAARRAQLGRLYLASGRFTSADAAFGDALTLDPTQGRVAVSRALVQLVLGHEDAARQSLAEARGRAPVADIGLALALAGQREDAVTLLEGAVRSGNADARTRQNLALVYAFEGRWSDAAATAARDVPADRLADRLRHWALIVQRGPRASDQVLAILGVKMAADPGQPMALALAVPAPAAVPMAIAATSIQLSPLMRTSTEDIETALLPIAIAPSPKLVDAALVARLSSPTTKPKPAAVRISPLPGKFVVQLGAYGSAARVEAAWRHLAGSAAYLPSFMPAQSRIQARISRASLYRLALTGFQTRADALRICGRIRARGGSCFVRAEAGDRPMTWASTAGRSADPA